MSAIRFTEDTAGKHYGCRVAPSVSFTCHLCHLWNLTSLDFEAWGSSAESEPPQALTSGQCSPSFTLSSVLPSASAHCTLAKCQSPTSHPYHVQKQEWRETGWFDQIPSNMLHCSSRHDSVVDLYRWWSCRCLLHIAHQRLHLPRNCINATTTYLKNDNQSELYNRHTYFSTAVDG